MFLKCFAVKYQTLKGLWETHLIPRYKDIFVLQHTDLILCVTALPGSVSDIFKVFFISFSKKKKKNPQNREYIILTQYRFLRLSLLTGIIGAIK